MRQLLIISDMYVIIGWTKRESYGYKKASGSEESEWSGSSFKKEEWCYAACKFQEGEQRR